MTDYLTEAVRRTKLPISVRCHGEYWTPFGLCIGFTVDDYATFSASDAKCAYLAAVKELSHEDQ